MILRQINSEKSQYNTNLGPTYHLVHKDTNPKDFALLGDIHLDGKVENVYAFIIPGIGHAIPLRTGEKAYIMSEDGRTFDNVSY